MTESESQKNFSVIFPAITAAALMIAIGLFIVSRMNELKSFSADLITATNKNQNVLFALSKGSAFFMPANKSTCHFIKEEDKNA
jgi:hypothetical protein